MEKNKLFSLLSRVCKADSHAKRRESLAGMMSGLLALILAACSAMIVVDGETMDSAITLTLGRWEGGKLNKSEERWYEFTATANIQYIHAERGTVDKLYVQLHDSYGDPIGNSYTYTKDSYTYTELPVTKDKKYYLKVQVSNSGGYKIRFTESADPDISEEMASATPLITDTWTRNELAIGGEHWYTFTATADTHYIHVLYGTLRDLYVQVYESGGKPLGDEPYNFDTNGEYASLLITTGVEYYLKVRPYADSGSGSYEIAFNTSTTPPLD
ncbi:MAG: hypothetical protein LBG05_04100 [Treponema sp.]|jgi:chitinase|nr:hypothetical protein [Treponema sp.]